MSLRIESCLLRYTRGYVHLATALLVGCALFAADPSQATGSGEGTDFFEIDIDYVTDVSGDGSTVVGFDDVGPECIGYRLRWLEEPDPVPILPPNGAILDVRPTAVSTDGSLIAGTTHGILQGCRAPGEVGLAPEVLLAFEAPPPLTGFGFELGIENQHDGCALSGSGLAYGISGPGAIVGTSRIYYPCGYGPADSVKAFLGSGSNVLGLGEARAVSADGSVVFGNRENGRQAWRWTSGSGLIEIPELLYSSITAVSADGNVAVGAGDVSFTGDFAFNPKGAFRYDGDGVEFLGHVPGNPKPYFSIATDVSGDGSRIVGVSVRHVGGVDEIVAFIWSEATGMRPLREVLERNGSDLTGQGSLASVVPEVSRANPYFSYFDPADPATIVPKISDDGTVIVGSSWLAYLPNCSDADGDFICDFNDNCACAANFSQLDSDGDGYGNACDADYDDDGIVGLPDLVTLIEHFGSSLGDPEYDPDVDFDGNGQISSQEVDFFATTTGLPPGPSGPLGNPDEPLVCELEPQPLCASGVGPLVALALGSLLSLRLARRRRG